MPLSVDEARVSGYRALDPPPNSPGGARQEAYLQSLTPKRQEAYDLALTGNPSRVTSVDTPTGRVSFPVEGCSARSKDQVLTDPVHYNALDTLVVNVTSLPQYRPDLDPALSTATKAWASCISTSGFSFTSPAKAVEAATVIEARANRSPNGKLPDTPVAGAIAVAVADAACRAKTHWDAANSAATRNALAVVAGAHAADILTFNNLASAAVRKARTLLH